MAVNVPGLISVAAFYILILIIGIYAGRKSTKSKSLTELFLADRNIGTAVSLFTITATWVGGGYINGTAEIISLQGLAWTQAPFGYSASLMICGYFFCPKMRRAKYVTMFDPFQDRYGTRVGALMCIPQFIADLLWTASILSALGATVHIILDLDETMSIIVSAVIAVLYTFVGGLWSVACTDVVQLICLAVGLIIAAPFAMTHPSVDLSSIQDKWQGEIIPGQIGIFIDLYCMITLGGTTWQEAYQRALACRTPEQARSSTMIAGIFCLLLSVPPAVIGIAGAAADWNATSYTGEVPIPPSQMGMILPLSLQYLCPLPVAIAGLGAVSAAVMSSTDSSVLVTSSVFTKNIYKTLIRTRASPREMIWVMRVTIIVAGALATILAIVGRSVYSLFVLSSDLMYVILFPQFVSVLFTNSANAYGSLVGFITGFALRILAGEPLIHLPICIPFPFYTETDGQRFPYRTLICLITFAVIYGVSRLADVLFDREILPSKYDVLRRSKDIQRDEAVEAEEMLGKGTMLDKEPTLDKGNNF
ncbi:high affinity choline transporter 1-like [Haliotis cracherodii]|uniref:high affinity choline transporter 1-like n=1 Tax=Haliotis cracherodii TaxID=6455 RepID=UPI0039E8496E